VIYLISIKRLFENALSHWGRAFSLWALFLFVLSFLGTSCTFFEKGKGKKVARVGNDYLYESDIKQVIPAGYVGTDSLEVIQIYINQWIKEKLALQEALDNIEDMPEDLDDQLENYKNSLILYQYQKELINLKLDTNISNKEIEDYYSRNKANFELKNNIIKVVYVKVDKKSKDLEKVRKWIKSSDGTDRKNLEDWCMSGAINYYLDDNSWLIFDDLLKEIPIKTYDQEDFLENNRFVEIQDSTGLYLVNIKGFKTKNDISPISVEKENIKNILLNIRKLAIVKTMEEKQFKEASDKGKFEIY
jgi:hypothetical protein